MATGSSGLSWDCMFGSTIANHILMPCYATEMSRAVISPRLEASYAAALLDLLGLE